MILKIETTSAQFMWEKHPRYTYILYLTTNGQDRWNLPCRIAEFLFIKETDLKKMAKKCGLDIRNKNNLDVEIRADDKAKVEALIAQLEPYVLAAKMVTA